MSFEAKIKTTSIFIIGLMTFFSARPTKAQLDQEQLTVVESCQDVRELNEEAKEKLAQFLQLQQYLESHPQLLSQFPIKELLKIEKKEGSITQEEILVADISTDFPIIDEHEDYIIKLEGKPHALSIRELLEKNLVDKKYKDLSPKEILTALKEEGVVEDYINLNEVLALLKTPDQKAFPILLSDARRQGNIFPQSYFKSPEKIRENNKAKIFDLRKIFIDIQKTPSTPAQKKSIPLAKALREKVLKMNDVVNILLQKSTPGSQRIFGIQRNGQGEVIPGSHDARDMGRLAKQLGVDGLMIWMSGGGHGGAVSVDPSTYGKFSGNAGSLSASSKFNVYDIDENLNYGGSFFANGRGIDVGGKLVSDFGAISPWYGYSNDWHGFGISGKVNINDVELLKALNAGAYIAMGKNYTGVGVSSSLNTSLGSAGISLYFSKSQNREVSIKQPDPKFKKDNMYKITLSQTDGRSSKMTLGVSDPFTNLGLGLRLGDGHSNTILYRTHLSREKALEYKADEDKLDLRSIGKELESADLPTLDTPMSWKDGDEIVKTKDDTYYGAFVIGLGSNLPIDTTIGASSNVSGTYELKVKKIEGNKVEVTINPVRIEEKGIFARILGIAGVNRSAGLTLALKQKFTFDFGEDLENFESQTAYRRLVQDGKLPNLLSDDLNFIREESHPGHIIEQLKIENKMLKEQGIYRNFMELVHLEHKRLAASAGLHIFDLPGISAESIRANGQRIVASEEVAVENKSSVNKKSKTNFHSGKQEQGAYATINTIWENPQSGEYRELLDNIVLTAELKDSKLTGDEENEIKAKLNKIFNLDFSSFKRDPGGRDRTVILERKLGIPELKALRENNRLQFAHKNSSLKKSDIIDFDYDIKNQGPGKIANIVKNFVAKHGIEGIGVLHYLLGGDVRDLKVRTHSNTYSAPINDTDKFLLRWTKRGDNTSNQEQGPLIPIIDTSSSPEDINKFFQEGRKLIEDIHTARLYLQDDQFMVGREDTRRWPEGIRQHKDDIRKALKHSFAEVRRILNLENFFHPSELEKIYTEVKPQNIELNEKTFTHLQRYRDPISIADSRYDLRHRFIDAHNLIEDIHLKDNEVNNLGYLSDDEVEEIHQQYHLLEQNLKDKLQLTHLTDPEDFDKLIETIDGRWFILPFGDIRYKYQKEMEIKGRFNEAKDRLIRNLAQQPADSSQVDRGIDLHARH